MVDLKIRPNHALGGASPHVPSTQVKLPELPSANLMQTPSSNAEVKYLEDQYNHESNHSKDSEFFKMQNNMNNQNRR